MTAENHENHAAMLFTGAAERLLEAGVAPDAVVRGMLGAALAFALRFDSGARIARQLQPALDDLAGLGREPAAVLQ
jgi:hypothetical protein